MPELPFICLMFIREWIFVFLQPERCFHNFSSLVHGLCLGNIHAWVGIAVPKWKTSGRNPEQASHVLIYKHLLMMLINYFPLDVHVHTPQLLSIQQPAPSLQAGLGRFRSPLLTWTYALQEWPNSVQSVAIGPAAQPRAVPEIIYVVSPSVMREGVQHWTNPSSQLLVYRTAFSAHKFCAIYNPKGLWEIILSYSRRFYWHLRLIHIHFKPSPNRARTSKWGWKKTFKFEAPNYVHEK